MTLPLITPISPLEDAEAVATSATVQVRLTQLTAEAYIDESTITMAVDGHNAIEVDAFTGDGKVTAGAQTFKSLFGKTWTSADIGKSLFVTSATNARNLGKCWVLSVDTDQQVKVQRESLDGTVSVSASSAAVTGSGTAFLSQVAAGDWLVFDEDYGNPLQVLTVSDDTNLTLTLPTIVAYSGVAFEPLFHTSESLMDWKLQTFSTGYAGTIVPYTNGAGTDGFDIEVWKTKELSGSISVATATTLVGIDTQFLSELHENARLTFSAKRTHEDPIVITSASDDDAAVIGSYTVMTTPDTYWRDADLPGGPASVNTVSVVIEAQDTLGQFVTVDPLAVDQPVNNYSFSTSTRPKITTISPELASPFGLGIRVFFSENLLGYASGTNTAISDPNTYSVVPSDPAITTPVVDSVTVPAGNPSYVDVLFSSAMTNEESYTLTIKNLGLRASSGNKLAETPYNAKTFAGYGPVEATEIYKDTLISKPEISGDAVIDYLTAPLTYEIHNLDDDVVSVALGPNSSGVELVEGSFVNNGDGTGTVQVAFSTSVTSYKISIVVTDDVDNESSESNIIGVVASADTVPGTSLTVRPQFPAHQEVCDRMINDIPDGSFYLRAGYIVGYTNDPMPFNLTVIEKGKPVHFVITRQGTDDKTETIFQTFIPQNLHETVFLDIGRGRNLIWATDGTKQDYILVSATTYATVICSIANEIYSHSQIEIDEVRNAIYSPVASRLAEPYLPYPEIVPTPSVQSQRQLATKLAIRALVVDSGSARAVMDTASAVTLQTSVPVPLVKNPDAYFEPGVVRLYTAQEAFSGVDLHTWYFNECINRWGAFVRFISNFPEKIVPKRVTENEVIIKDPTGTYQRHEFDSSDPACSTLSGNVDCLEGFVVRLGFSGNFIVPICAASYPFDSCFDVGHPLGGRAAFDSEVVWDSDVPLDYDLLDPGEDGWVGFCWADRWDSGITIDSSSAGTITEDSAFFEDLTFNFTDDNLKQWVRITSGSRTGLRRILGVVDSTHVRLDTIFDIDESGLEWELVKGVHPLDSSYGVLAPVESFTSDGITVAGSDVFATGGKYIFSSADLARNLIISNSLDGIVSLFIVEIISDSSVRVERKTNLSDTEQYLFQNSQGSLDWELWDPNPNCMWDGYANKMVLLSSSDIPHDIGAEVSMTLDGGTAATMDAYYVPSGEQCYVHQNGGIDDTVATIPVTDTTGFAGSGTILIDSEIITYAGTTATSFTGCTRGTNGSTAAAHDGGLFTTLSSNINNSVVTIPVASTGTGVSTTLTGAHTNSTATLNVGSTAGFASSGVIHVGEERVTYTGVTATSFTGCVRGFDGTTPAAYSGGETVFVPLFAIVGTLTMESEKFSYTGMTENTFTGVTRGADSTTPASHLSGVAVVYAEGALVIEITITAISTPNRYGTCVANGVATVAATASVMATFGTMELDATASVSLTPHVLRNASATITGIATAYATGTGGTDADPGASAHVVAQGWVACAPTVLYSAAASITGEATVTAELNEIQHGEATLIGVATVSCVGSIS